MLTTCCTGRPQRRDAAQLGGQADGDVVVGLLVCPRPEHRSGRQTKVEHLVHDVGGQKENVTPGNSSGASRAARTYSNVEVRRVGASWTTDRRPPRSAWRRHRARLIAFRLMRCCRGSAQLAGGSPPNGRSHGRDELGLFDPHSSGARRCSWKHRRRVGKKSAYERDQGEREAANAPTRRAAGAGVRAPT